MKKEEYWLLDAAIETGIRIRLFHPDNPELEDALNRGHHGLAVPDLVQTLHHLFQRGDIVAFNDRTLYPHTDYFIPTSSDIERTLIEKRPDLHYRLTAQGGTRWEIATQADWQRFSNTSASYHGEHQHVVIEAGNMSILEKLFSIHSSIYYDREILQETVLWEEVEHWQATYWKTLPIGYRVEFCTIPRTTIPASQHLQFAQQHERLMQQWSMYTKWYTNYLEQ